MKKSLIVLFSVLALNVAQAQASVTCTPDYIVSSTSGTFSGTGNAWDAYQIEHDCSGTYNGQSFSCSGTYTEIWYTDGSNWYQENLDVVDGCAPYGI